MNVPTLQALDVGGTASTIISSTNASQFEWHLKLTSKPVLGVEMNRDYLAGARIELVRALCAALAHLHKPRRPERGQSLAQ